MCAAGRHGQPGVTVLYPAEVPEQGLDTDPHAAPLTRIGIPVLKTVDFQVVVLNRNRVVIFVIIMGYSKRQDMDASVRKGLLDTAAVKVSPNILSNLVSDHIRRSSFSL